MTLPNFLVIGAEKAATTSLYNYLAEHPQVYMSPVKEPRFFSHEGDPPIPQIERLRQRGMRMTTRLADYEALFAAAGDAPARGEASPNYFSTFKAAARIRQLIPDAKMVVSLRNPAERAYSLYWMLVREGQRPRSFTAELDIAFDELRAAGPDALERLRPEDFPFHAGGYLVKGMYGRLLRRWFALFPRQQFLFLRFEDIERDPACVMRRVYGFLDVDAGYALKNREAFGRSGVVRRPSLFRAVQNFRHGPLLRRLLPPWLVLRARNRLVDVAMGSYPQMPADARARLAEFFRGDILETEKLLGWDLKAWLQ